MYTGRVSTHWTAPVHTVLHCTMPHRYLQPTHLILYDGAFSDHFFGFFLAPTTGYYTAYRDTPHERVMNKLIRSCRAVVEHFFGRLKTQWPILEPYKQPRERIRAYFLAGMALTNISSLYEKPLRKTRCINRTCYFCTHLAN